MLFTNAILLAMLTFVGGYMLWDKLPHGVRKWLQRQGLLTDVLLTYAGYLLLGGTATALMAAAIFDVMVATCIYVVAHPDDFRWLFELLDQAKAGLNGILRELNGRTVVSAQA